MLNNGPIFINGFNRGGTNILQFIVLSHPDVCVLRGEIHEIFYGRSTAPVGKWIDRGLYFPIMAIARQHIFYTRCLEERNKIPRFLMNYIDLLLYRNKLISSANRYKTENIKYSKDEIKKSRLLCKNTNGVIFTTNLFSEMYPDATFIALVRNGLALCESYVRRGWNAEDFGTMYEKVCQKIISDNKTVRNYLIIRFEDLVQDPVPTTKKIYEFARLDITGVTKLKLQSKKSMDKNGVRKFMFGEKRGESHWVKIESIGDHLRKDVNKNQIAQLSQDDRKKILQKAKNSMKHFGYL